MRVRAALLILFSTWALLAASAGAASALQLGPVQLPVAVPPIPAVAPIVAAKVSPREGVQIAVPDVGVAVSPTAGVSIGVTDPNVGVVVEPKRGVTIGVTVPKNIGPVTVPPVVPSSAQVTIGPEGIGVTTAPGSSGAGTIAAPSAPAVSSPAPAVSSPAPAVSSTAPAVPASPPRSGPTRTVPLDPARHAAVVVTVGGATPSVAAAANAHRSATAAPGSPSSAGEVAVHDAVNASLDHAAPGSTWALAREVVSDRFALWIALLAILVVARWALSGLVRDARRKARVVSSV